MNLADIMAEIAERVATVPEVHAFGYSVDVVTPDLFEVNLPTLIDYDETYGGKVRIVLTGNILVGRKQDRSSQLRLLRYVNPDDERSIKAAIERGTPRTCDWFDVKSAVPAMFPVGAVEWLGAQFAIELEASREE